MNVCLEIECNVTLVEISDQNTAIAFIEPTSLNICCIEKEGHALTGAKLAAELCSWIQVSKGD